MQLLTTRENSDPISSKDVGKPFQTPLKGKCWPRKALRVAAVFFVASLAGCATGTVEENPSPFGTVHGGSGDTTIDPAWIKTIWTPQAVDGTSANTAHWRSLLSRATRFNQIEVPVVADDVWKSGNIAHIKKVMRQFFRADPTLPVWEMGLEENLRPGWKAKLPETARKLAAVREVKNSVNPEIQLAYQIVDDRGRPGGPLDTFLKSAASNYTDIIALHPYAWPDFKTPELWLDRLLSRVQELESGYGKNLPVWFTEVGAPTNEAGVQLYSGSRPVSGITPHQQADYLVKVYATALNAGVAKIFWYEYKDSCSTSSDVECHFGLKYYDGTPKPAYHAYKAVSLCVSNKKPAGERILGSTRISSFSGGDQECLVVWNYPAGRKLLPLSAVGATSQNTEAFDVTGRRVPISNEKVAITDSPLFLEISNH